jgi:hypothetical protein
LVGVPCMGGRAGAGASVDGAAGAGACGGGTSEGAFASSTGKGSVFVSGAASAAAAGGATCMGSVSEAEVVSVPSSVLTSIGAGAKLASAVSAIFTQ